MGDSGSSNEKPNPKIVPSKPRLQNCIERVKLGFQPSYIKCQKFTVCQICAQYIAHHNVSVEGIGFNFLPKFRFSPN